MQVDGPYDGHVTSFVQDPSTGKIYATGMGRGAGGGVFVTADGGDSWNRVAGNAQIAETTFNEPPLFGEFYENIGLPNVSGTLVGNLKLGLDPATTPATLYVAYFYSNTAPKVWRSVDEGVSWTMFMTGLPAGNPYAFASAPGGFMFLAMIGGVGVYRLPPGGAMWEACGTGTTNARAIAVDDVNGDIYFTNQQNTLDPQRPAVFRSTDNGVSFIGVTVPTSLVGGGAADAGSYNRLVTSIAVDSSQVPHVIHVGVKDRYNWFNETFIATGGHYRSTDSGATWTQSVVMNVETLTVDAAGRVFLGHADNASYYGAIYRSADRGVTFARIAHPGIDDAAAVIALQSLPSGMLMAGGDGAYRSMDGGATWTHLDRRGLDASRRTTDVAIGADGVIYSASNQHGISVSTDGGATWNIANGAGASRIGSLFVYTVAVNPVTQDVFAGTGLVSAATTGMWRSTDRGATWTRVSGFTAQYKGTDIVFAQNGNIIFGGMFSGPGGVFYSTDGGLTAVSSSNPPGAFPGRFNPVFSLVTNSVTGDIYAGTETQSTWRSTDHGLSFTELGFTTAMANGCTGQDGNKGNIFSVAVEPSGTTVYEAALRGLFKTVDQGVTWQEVAVPGFGGCGQTGWHVFVDPNSTLYYFYVENGGGLAPKLRQSTDGGATWNWFNTGLVTDSRGAAGTMGLALNPVDGKIYTGMSGVTSAIKQGPTGLYKTVLPVVAGAPAPTCTLLGPIGCVNGTVALMLTATDMTLPNSLSIAIEHSPVGMGAFALSTMTAASPNPNPTAAAPGGMFGYEWDAAADGAGVSGCTMYDMRVTVTDDTTGTTGTCLTTVTVDTSCTSPPLCGDCDGNGSVNILDALLTATVDLGLVPSPVLGSPQFNACNVQGVLYPSPGAVISVLDALNIARFAVGLAPLICC